MNRGQAWTLAGAWAWSLLAGCGAAVSETGSGVLAGAQFDIPVYPGARVVGQNEHAFQQSMLPGGRRSAASSTDPTAPASTDGASSAWFERISWELVTEAPVSQVIAFYEQRLADEERLNSRTDARDGSDAPEQPGESDAEFKYRPADARDDDSVTISISEARIEITQITRRK